ncbi:MAG TPA: UPF0182 family protein [Peptococcaceae bacterium]|nr:UPF0182 family protein [Clostridia bacterium]HOB81362.1 UPF0182 family protein [Peptococcaceae bacterium]HPZ71539.1 UPF0182 family protein [Peptococcaceae bacterium]HQD54552.1 UPF0182 family protein [Peptococcaceae bacterium]
MAEIYDYPPGKDQYKHKPKGRVRKWVLFGGLVLLYLFLRFFVAYKLDWTWFSVLGYESVFWRTLSGKILVTLGLFAVAFLVTYLNVFLIYKIAKKPFRAFIALISAFLVGLMAASNGSQLWMQILQYAHAEPFQLTDPIFNRDIGFYVFHLPVFWLVYRLVNMLLVVNLLLTIPLYLFLILGRMSFSSWSMMNSALAGEGKKAWTHTGLLVAVFLAWQAVQYKLAAYELLYSQGGSVIGAGATDIEARLPAFQIMLVLSLLVGIFVFFTLRKRMRWAVLSVVSYFIAAALLTGVFPTVYQRFVIDPDEINREMKYIKYNLDYTTKAYGLDKITEEEYPVGELTADKINENRDIIDNIRLLDHRATLNIYAQQQENRFYYQFVDVDVDRYLINGKPTQVFLSARELNKPAIAENRGAFTNLLFKYTHGFGIVMSPANTVDKTGLPAYLIKDIPPRSTVGEVKQPRVYFGEATNDNVIVKTTLNEYDYPFGEDNMEYYYEENLGIPMTFTNKLLLALRDMQYRYLFSDYITEDSLYLETRNIVNRAQRIAPFLSYDQDPYVVMDKNGNLFYMLDAYTMTNKYPYAQAANKQGTFNYIRNSVKIVVNAYSGAIDFYIFDEQDPLIKVFRNIFPQLFKSKEMMPDDLREHVRYPEDLFNVQSLILREYHMANPTVFFTREDRWEIGEEVYWDKTQPQEAFYSIIRLPGEEKEEYVLMRVFTPATKKNMVSWLAARSDGDHYGKLLLYRFPKGVQVPGTAQVESQIDQDPEISAQLSLWERGGSRVLRGNLLVYPIAGSLLYVEPLYIEAEQTKYPQLKKVLVYYKDTVVMEDTLEQALVKLFGEKVGAEGTPKGTGTEQGGPGTPESGAPGKEPGDETAPGDRDEGMVARLTAEEERELRSLFTRLLELENSSKEKLRAADWAGFGQAQQELEQVIRQINDLLS